MVKTQFQKAIDSWLEERPDGVRRVYSMEWDRDDVPTDMVAMKIFSEDSEDSEGSLKLVFTVARPVKPIKVEVVE